MQSTYTQAAGLILTYERSADVIVNALRAGETPKNLYVLLRDFAESNANAPIIYTNRGNTLFIDYDRIEDLVTLYVGDSKSCVLVERSAGKALYAMNLVEKYQFSCCPLRGRVLKNLVASETKVVLFSMHAQASEAYAVCIDLNEHLLPVKENPALAEVANAESSSVDSRNVVSVFSHRRKSKAASSCA